MFHKHTLIFMPPDRMIGGILFCPVCLFVCLLSVVNFNLCYFFMLYRFFLCFIEGDCHIFS